MSMAGRYMLSKSENYDEWMKAIGTPYYNIVATRQFRPIIDITHTGDEVVMKSHIGNAYNDHILKFTIGQECPWTAYGGTLSPFRVKLEKGGNNTYKGTYTFNEFKGKTTFEVHSDKLVQIYSQDGITARKEYKRI